MIGLLLSALWFFAACVVVVALLVFWVIELTDIIEGWRERRKARRIRVPSVNKHVRD